MGSGLVTAIDGMHCNIPGIVILVCQSIGHQVTKPGMQCAGITCEWCEIWEIMGWLIAFDITSIMCHYFLSFASWSQCSLKAQHFLRPARSHPQSFPAIIDGQSFPVHGVKRVGGRYTNCSDSCTFLGTSGDFESLQEPSLVFCTFLDAVA